MGKTIKCRMFKVKFRERNISLLDSASSVQSDPDPFCPRKVYELRVAAEESINPLPKRPKVGQTESICRRQN